MDGDRENFYKLKKKIYMMTWLSSPRLVPNLTTYFAVLYLFCTVGNVSSNWVYTGSSLRVIFYLFIYLFLCGVGVVFVPFNRVKL